MLDGHYHHKIGLQLRRLREPETFSGSCSRYRSSIGAAVKVPASYDLRGFPAYRRAGNLIFGESGDLRERQHTSASAQAFDRERRPLLVAGASLPVASQADWFLNRWAWHVTVGTKHAAIAWFGFHCLAARLALIEELAGIDWHFYRFLVAAVWAFQSASRLDHRVRSCRLNARAIWTIGDLQVFSNEE